ncbi:Transmembrane protein [Orchesella cincta]|uniref:Transmembrane protein n=1 Tax=Orchesella cincta TaxID=48709 RepID=A0A1D2NGR9_ORCCI|nr:Transmembrane protein [Orchesella cincta]
MPQKQHYQHLAKDMDSSGEFPDDMELEFYIQFPTAKDKNLNSHDVVNGKSEDKIWPVLTSSSDTVEADREKDVLIVLLGWAGAQHKYLSKYSDYYLNRGCIVLRYITPLRYHFVDTRKLPHLAEKIVRLLKDLQLDAHPTFFHVFSNGGAFTYSYILRELARVQNTFQMDIKGTIFDSAPSPRSMQTCFQALVSIFSNLRIFRFLAAAFVIFLLVCQVFWYHLKTAVNFCIVGDSLDALESPGRCEATPLTNWLGRIAKLRNHNFLFLYSDGDELIPCDKIERFAAIAEARGNKVEKVKFAGSEHVLHYRKYPKEYGSAVTQFVRSTMKEHRGKTIWEDE